MTIANPDDHDYADNLYHFAFGAYGSTTLYVWADHLESALEEACDWLADNAPGLFTFFDKADYLAACETDAERVAIRILFGAGGRLTDDDAALADAITERAEADHTVVGHTTYPQFDSPPFLSSSEWHVREVH